MVIGKSLRDSIDEIRIWSSMNTLTNNTCVGKIRMYVKNSLLNNVYYTTITLRYSVLNQAHKLLCK